MSRFWIAILAPVEIVLCILHGAWVGARDGINNVRDAWRGRERYRDDEQAGGK